MPDSDKSLDQTLRQLDHDLRSPLSTIAMGIEAIKALKHDPAQIEMLCQMIQDQGVEEIKRVLATFKP